MVFFSNVVKKKKITIWSFDNPGRKTSLLVIFVSHRWDLTLKSLWYELTYFIIIFTNYKAFPSQWILSKLMLGSALPSVFFFFFLSFLQTILQYRQSDEFKRMSMKGYWLLLSSLRHCYYYYYFRNK